MDLKILVDWNFSGELFIENELKKRGIDYSIYGIPNYTMKDRTNKYRIILLYFKYLLQAYKVLSNSSKNEIIVCWNFTSAIAVGLINKIRRKHCKILGLNIIAPLKHGIVDKLRFMLFHSVMKEDNFFITVNSNEYVTDYCNRFKINPNKFFVLHDAISTDDTMDFNYRKSYIFSGGEAKRDWETMFKACEYCPDLKFVFIAREKFFDTKLKVPENATLLFDLEEEVFYDYLKKSSLVVLPLQTKLPAGLIVLLRCAMFHKPVIVSRTPSTENYLEHNKSGFLINLNDYKDLSLKIKMLYYDSSLQKSFTNALYDKVIKYHSPENRAVNLLDILNTICKTGFDN